MVDSTGDCVSNLRIDRWLGGELDADERERFAAHIEVCRPCAARVEAFGGFRDDFAAAPMPAALAAAFAAAGAEPGANAKTETETEAEDGAPAAAERALTVHHGGRADAREGIATRPSARRRPWLAVAPVLAAAAAVLLWLRVPAAPEGEFVTGERSKGSAHLTAYVVRDGVANAAHAGEIVHPDDILQMVYTATEPGYLAVLSRDGAGVVSVYFDDESGRAAAMEAGRELSLPHSITLDDVLGRETLYTLFCTGPAELGGLREQLADAFEPAAVRAPAGCRIETMDIEKRAP